PPAPPTPSSPTAPACAPPPPSASAAFPTPADQPRNPYANSPYGTNPYASPATSPATSPSASPATSPSASPTVSDDERGRRIRRRAWTITTASSVVSTAVLAGVILWMVDPTLFGGDGDDSAKGSGNRPDTTASAPANDRSAAPPTAAGQPVADDEESGSDDGDDGAEAPADLLTPQGARQAIAALKPLMGGTKVTDFTLYGEHASAQAPLKSNSRLYDRFSYRDGQAKNDDMGGTLMSGDKAVDLNAVDWDALPALLRTARTALNIPEPESSYVIVDPSSPFHGDRPVLRVYVSDKYGGAYLTAELDGRVIEKNPREKG
ncbi:serine/threonine protein kinase, partial [Streptomyces cyaneofuscatus]